MKIFSSSPLFSARNTVYGKCKIRLAHETMRGGGELMHGTAPYLRALRRTRSSQNANLCVCLIIISRMQCTVSTPS